MNEILKMPHMEMRFIPFRLKMLLSLKRFTMFSKALYLELSEMTIKNWFENIIEISKRSHAEVQFIPPQ